MAGSAWSLTNRNFKRAFLNEQKSTKEVAGGQSAVSTVLVPVDSRPHHNGKIFLHTALVGRALVVFAN